MFDIYISSVWIRVVGSSVSCVVIMVVCISASCGWVSVVGWNNNGELR